MNMGMSIGGHYITVPKDQLALGLEDNELLPCPFCGSRGSKLSDTVNPLTFCTGCDASTSTPEAWNMRYMSRMITTEEAKV